MNQKLLRGLFVLAITGGLFLGGIKQNSRAAENAPLTVQVPTAAIAEASDYAEENWDAWDMNEFSDISQGFNGAGRYPSIKNFQVANGIFSGDSLGDSTKSIAEIPLLYPGYTGFIQVSHHLGSMKPIKSSNYNCLYVAMKVDSPAYPNPGITQPDSLMVWWDSNTNGLAPRGAFFIRTYPESVPPLTTPLVHNWKLYRIDLSNPPYGLMPDYDTPWNGRSDWTGLKITPTIYKDIHFQIDWARLVSCAQNPAYNARITWNSSSAVNAIWAQPDGTTRNILLASGINGSSGAYDLDTRGLTPGQYKIGLGTLTDCCSQWSGEKLTINAAPVATFVTPSPTSGEDYSSHFGNPWHMDSTDVTSIRCSTFSFSDTILSLDTLPPASLPSNCKGGLGEAESQMYLNMPGDLSQPGQYRYLTFRLYQSGDVAEPADGMMARWMWTTYDTCTQVGADIPFDVGWHTYIIDLYDAFNGMPVTSAPGSCPRTHWTQTGAIKQLRLDPNENYTGVVPPIQPQTFHQEFDWVRLTKEPQVTRGQSFQFQATFNKSPSTIPQIAWYYTDDLSKPLKYQAVGYNPTQPRPTQGSIFLPLVGRNMVAGQTPVTPLPNSVAFTWNTAQVAAGKYYICITADDGLNEHESCSQAPVVVLNP